MNINPPYLLLLLQYKSRYSKIYILTVKARMERLREHSQSSATYREFELREGKRKKDQEISMYTTDDVTTETVTDRTRRGPCVR